MIEDIRKTLWATSGKLRANMNAADYKYIVLDLIFAKYISKNFQWWHGKIARRFLDPNDDYFLLDSDKELIASQFDDRDYYRKANAFWVPEAVRWESLRAQTRQADIGDASKLQALYV